MLGFRPFTLKTENEFNTPLGIGNCVAFGKMGASMGLEQTAEVLDVVEFVMQFVTAETFAGIALASVTPIFCPLPLEVPSSRG